MVKKQATITVNAKELAEFLKYFYYVEEIAQNTGLETGSRFTDATRSLHSKLMKAEQELGIWIE